MKKNAMKVMLVTLMLLAGLVGMVRAQSVSVAPESIRTVAIMQSGTSGIGYMTNTALDEVWIPIAIGQDVGANAVTVTNTLAVSYIPSGSTIEYRVDVLDAVIAGAEVNEACVGYPPFRYGDIYKFTSTSGGAACTNVVTYLIYGKTFSPLPRR